MNIVQILLISGGVISFLLLITLGVLFFVSRKTQKTIESLLQIMLRPEQAKIHDAIRVLNTILADEISKIESCFNTMRDTLNSQIASTDMLKQQLSTQNDNLVSLADNATKNLANMSQRLDNTVLGLQNIIASSDWKAVELSTEKFSNTINELLQNINVTSENTSTQISHIQSDIDNWLEKSKSMSESLQNTFATNEEQHKLLTSTTQELNEKLSALAKSTAEEFNTVKTASAEYESVLNNNNKLMESHLTKLDTFSKQATKQLKSQENTLVNTANVIGAQVRLTESSLEQQIRKLSDMTESLISTSSATENSVRTISGELTALTNRFNDEIKEFARDVVSEIKTVSGVAKNTLESTETATAAFSESVTNMATSVRDTLIKMNAAHTQLSGQSANLIKLSKETTAQLQPLSELIEKYYAALPDLSRNSIETNDNLTKIVANLDDKINLMKSTITESSTAISDSAVKLEDLAGQSRQQMIDLMSDYAKAVNTMQTLNKQMMVARASAPMDAISAVPTEKFSIVSADDFLKQSERLFEKMHEQSLDLVRATGAEIPDVIWKKYHAGDKTIFSKWLAKMLNAAEKKRVRDMLKNDAVFASQTTQFVRSFDKILTSAKSADATGKLSGIVLKTDLGHIYTVLKNQLS